MATCHNVINLSVFHCSFTNTEEMKRVWVCVCVYVCVKPFLRLLPRPSDITELKQKLHMLNLLILLLPEPNRNTLKVNTYAPAHNTHAHFTTLTTMRLRSEIGATSLAYWFQAQPDLWT